jgi:hypothetical protein
VFTGLDYIGLMNVYLYSIVQSEDKILFLTAAFISEGSPTDNQQVYSNLMMMEKLGNKPLLQSRT